MSNTKTGGLFVVQSDEHGTIFRVREIGDNIKRKAVATILEKLPISFSISKADSKNHFDQLNEPLEVYAYAQVICIYPPRHRIIACTCMDWAKQNDLIREMNVDNVMDIQSPGGGQIRTCVHFDSKILGVTEWADLPVDEVEVDIHVYHYGKEDEPKIKPARFGKSDVRNLLELIAGGERPLTPGQFQKWRNLIMYVVADMKACYENPDVAEDYPVRLYYRPCWKKIEEAGDDLEKLVNALEYLRSSVQWE